MAVFVENNLSSWIATLQESWRRRSFEMVNSQGTTREPDWITRGRIPSLDGLRAVAVVLVLLNHARLTTGFPDIPLLHGIGKVGAIGVEVFFVLSGFLITTLMLREQDRTGELNLTGFYWRRLLRIAPAYVALLLAVAALQWVGVSHLERRDWFAAITMTMNFVHRSGWELGHAWSLSIEEHFYLLWPLAFVLTPRKWHVAQLAICIAFCFVARWIVLIAFPEWTPMSENWTFTRLDTIALGCLLAFVARQRTWRDRLDRVTACWPGILLLLVASLAVSNLSAKWTVGIAFLLNGVCIALLVWTAARRSPKWLNGRAISVIGVGSYSLYLWQQLFLNPQRDSWVTAYPQNLVLTTLTALASFWIVEIPFLRWKDRQRKTSVIERARSLTAASPTGHSVQPPTERTKLPLPRVSV